MYTSIGDSPAKSEDDDIVWVMSCDIGKRNFAMSICEYNRKDLHTLRQVYREGRWNDVTEGVINNHKIIMMDLVDFVGYSNSIMSQDIYVNIIHYFDRIKPWLDLCTCFVLEKQIKRNPEAIGIEHHVHSYLLVKYELTKEVVSYQSKLKYSELDYPKNIKKKYYRKKWACDRISGILKKKGDTASLKYIFETHKTKKDDLSDTLLQSFSFMKRVFVKQVL
jgi:hypothetical protein